MFWLGFVLWYAAPNYPAAVDWTGTPGAIMCIYGMCLALSAALSTGSLSFLGQPQAPRALVTGGTFSLLRHPQCLGNFLFLIGDAAGAASTCSPCIYP